MVDCMRTPSPLFSLSEGDILAGITLDSERRGEGVNVNFHGRLVGEGDC
jgi:hypothetical protein